MTFLLMIAGLSMSWGPVVATTPPQEVDPAGAHASHDMVQTVDRAATGRCMGEMVGFRNVPVRCVVGADGRLGDCEVRSTNRTVLRYSRVFRCMAAAVRMTYPDGTPAVGRSVALRIHGTSIFDDSPPPSAR